MQGCPASCGGSGVGTWTMELITDVIRDCQLPAVAAFVLGLLVALHPCSLAANVAAVGFLGNGNVPTRRFFVLCIAYTVGRIACYSLLGIALLALLRGGADLLAIGDVVGRWGERLLAPLLIVIGVCLIGAHLLHRDKHCHTKGSSRWGECFQDGIDGIIASTPPDDKHHFYSMDDGRTHSWFSIMLSGVVTALFFCPESAVVYFGMIIPMSAEAGSGGYLMPVVFAVGTSLPVIALAWCFRYSVTRLDALCSRMHNIQRVACVVVGLLFIAAGVLLFFV